MSTGLAVVATVLLLAANAFFVGAEFAVVSARRSAIEPLAEGSARARTVLWAMEHVSLMLACAQLGITVASVSLGVVAEPALAHLIEGPITAVGLPGSAVHPAAVVIALAVVVYLHVVLGEMVPKNLAVAGPERAALWFAPPLVWLARGLSPVIAALNWLANVVVRMAGLEPKDEVTSAYTVEEVQSIVERSKAEGLLHDAQGLLKGAIQFSDRTAADVMVPVPKLVWLAQGCTVEDVERSVARTGFSRFPVMDDDGGLVGYLHLKDVLYAGPEDRAAPVPGWRVRSLAEVAPDAEVEDALVAMQRTGAHLARVVQPAERTTMERGAGVSDGVHASGVGGRLLGVVFLEDILEELVGEVRDAMQRRHPGMS
jgi:CBS domain containing-hemolysin-like protein